MLTIANAASLPEPNSPAGDYWVMYVAYSQNVTAIETRIPIAFLPTGELDMTHTSPDDLTKANNLLAPTLQLLQSFSNDSTLDLWKVFNWLVVGYYWGLLADLGQVAPTGYDLTIPNDPLPVPFPSTNNIFINATLFEIFSSYFYTTFGPILEGIFSNATYPPILLNDENRLTPVETTLLRSYSCSQWQLKNPASLVISVIVANYALIKGSYALVLLVAGWFQKRKDDRKDKVNAMDK
jgi:hypothetical protein